MMLDARCRAGDAGPMFDDILEKLGGPAAMLDPRKVVDLVDELWGSREKVVAAIKWVDGTVIDCVRQVGQ